MAASDSSEPRRPPQMATCAEDFQSWTRLLQSSTANPNSTVPGAPGEGPHSSCLGDARPEEVLRAPKAAGSGVQPPVGDRPRHRAHRWQVLGDESSERPADL